MKISLTPTQADGYRIIRDYIRMNNKAPTVRELAPLLGLKSTSGVDRLLKNLEKRGWIRREPGLVRSITLVQEQVIDFTDPGVRAALLQAGWRPPMSEGEKSW